MTLTRFLALSTLLPLMAGCAIGELPEPDCTDPTKLRGITIHGDDRIILPNIVGEQLSLNVTIVLEPSPTVQMACLRLIDPDFLSSQQIAFAKIPIPANATSVEARPFQLTCSIDPEVIARNSTPVHRDGFTGEKSTNVFIRGYRSRVKSNKIRVQCPDLITTG